MKREYVVIRPNGAIESGHMFDDAECERLSNLAEYSAIVDLRETPRGLHTVYQDGVRRQIDLPTRVIMGAAQPFRGRNGWTS